MEGDVSGIYSLFGPGVIYSHNTLQNFVDYFVRIDFNKCKDSIPFITQATKQKQNADIDQLSDLDESRSFLLENFEKFLSPSRYNQIPLRIIREEPTIPDLSVRIAETFLFPSLELMAENNAKCAEESIHTLSNFFKVNKWNGECDISDISHRIVKLLSSIFTKSKQLNISEESTKELIDLWISFFDSHGIIEDLLFFTIAWIRRGESIKDINIDDILQSIKKSIIYPTIASSSILSYNDSNSAMTSGNQSNSSFLNSNQNFLNPSSADQAAPTPVHLFPTPIFQTIYNSNNNNINNDINNTSSENILSNSNTQNLFNNNSSVTGYSFGFPCGGVSPEGVQLYIGKLIDQKSPNSSNAFENIQRRAAALYGFLFVADPRFGLAKFGTGKNGTVFSSLELQDPEFAGKVPQSLAISNDKLLIRYFNNSSTSSNTDESTESSLSSIEVLDLISFKKIGFILNDGTFSKNDKKIERGSTDENEEERKFIPTGPFTAMFDKVYFVEKSNLFIYEFTEEKILRFIKTVPLISEDKTDFSTAQNLISLVTNGHFLSIFYPQKLFERNFVSVREFNIETGLLVIDKQIPLLLSNCICLDHVSFSLFDLPDYEIPILYNCQPNILSFHDFPFPSEMTGIAPLDILNTLPSLLSSRLSNQVYSLKSKYVLMSAKYIYKTLNIALNTDGCIEFLTPLIKLLYLHLFQFRDAKLPSVDLIHKIIQCEFVCRKDKVFFIRSLFFSSYYPMNNLEHLHTILDLIEPSMFIEATQVFDIFQLNHLKSILNARDNKFIDYAVNHYNHQSYSFIQILIVSISTYAFRDHCIQSSYILPIFQSLKPVNSHLFLSAIATMLPLLQKALSDPLAFVSSLTTVELFLKEMHSMIPPNALKDYAIFHSSVSSEQPFDVATVIDETPHPYQNNMEYVHHYDFPLAIEITVTFDPKTISETNCDYLQIFLDRDCNKKLTDKLSGRFSRWKDKIVTNSKHLAFKFHSDASVNEWGYKATISAKLFSRNNFTSPDPAYDVFRTFFDILLKMMKICDAATMYIPNNCYSFDDYSPLNISDISEYLSNILQKLGIKYYNDKYDTGSGINLLLSNGNNKKNKIYDEIDEFAIEDINETEDNIEKKKQLQEHIYEMNCQLLVRFINNKFGIAINDNYQFTSLQLNLINYLLFNSNKEEEEIKNSQIQDFIQISIESPFSVSSFNSKSLPDHFSNLANLMLFYIPQGIPDSELDFLYKSLKGTKAAEKFVKDSLAFAESSFKSPELSLASVCYAANKASLAFQLLQNPDFSSFRDNWFDCLRALSKIKTTPNSTMTPTSLDSILDFGCMFGNAFDDVNDFIERHLELLNETEINDPTVDIPIVILILRRILLIDSTTINNNIIVSLILRAMQFCLPYIIPFINEIIDKFSVHLDNNKNHVEILMKILQGIGEGYKTIAKMTEPDSICFDYGVSFSCLKAECIRKMITDISIFTDIMKKGTTEIKLASLLILSSRCFQLRPSHHVYVNDLDVEATVSSIDPFRYVLKMATGDEISVPAYDFTRICPLKSPFTRILPDEFKSCSIELAKTVISELDGSNKLIALNALNELLPYAEVDFASLFNQLLSSFCNSQSQKDKSDKESPCFVRYNPMIEMLPANQVAYICSQSLTVYKFTMQSMQGQFGFCDKGNTSPSSAILFNCNEKCVNYHDIAIAENETIYSIIIGYLTDGMRIFLIVNKQLKLTDIYLPPSQSLFPVVITNTNTEVIFDCSPVIELPMFNNQLSTVGYSPSHIFFNDRIISIDSICSPIVCKYDDPISFDLYPSVSSKLPFYFIEFALSPEMTSVSLRSPIHRSFSFYKYNTPNVSPNDTFGLFINFKENYCFVTLNEAIQKESITEIPKSDWIITFHAKTLETVFVNIGQLPFMFDVDSFIEFLSEKEHRSILEFNNLEHINSSSSQKTEINIITPLQKPFVSTETSNLNLFSNNQPKFIKTSFVRPCLINTSEKGSFYHGKIGYGRLNEANSTVDLIVSCDGSFTISNIKSLPSNSCVSLIDETSASVEEFQQIFQHFVSTIPITFCLNLSPFTIEKKGEIQNTNNLISSELTFESLNGKTDFFFGNRKELYFESMSRSKQFSIMSTCLLKIIQEFGLNSALERINISSSFDDFFVDLITNIDCDDFEPFLNLDKISYKPILDIIFDSIEKETSTIFDKLCQRALLPFQIQIQDFADTTIYPLNIISHSNDSSATNRITINNAEAILFIPVDTKFISKPHKFQDNHGNLFVISKYTTSSASFLSKSGEEDSTSRSIYSYNCCGGAYISPIFIMKGDTVTFDALQNDELILGNVIPINFSKPQTKALNFRYSIQFISQLIEYVKNHRNNSEIVKKTFNLILKPLWMLYMKNTERLFPQLQAKWFSVLFDGFCMTCDMKRELKESSNFDVLIKDQPNILTGIVCLLTLFVRFNEKDNYLAMRSVAHILEFALDSPRNTYAVQVFRQFSAEMQSPFRSTLPFPSCETAFTPLLTSLALRALGMSRLPSQAKIITQNEKNELPNSIVCTFEGASKIAFVKISPLTKITLTVNKSEIKPDCLINGDSASIKITRSQSENSRKIAFMLIPIYPERRPNSNDVNTLHHFNRRLREDWNESNESLARCIIQRPLKEGSFYSFAFYPDEIYKILFPNIEPEVARYRLSLLYLMYEKLDEDQVPYLGPIRLDKANLNGKKSKETFGGKNGLLIDDDLAEILEPKRILPERKLSPISVNLPMKDAKFSDFFFQLAQIIETAPLDSLTTLGNLLKPPGESESRAVDAVLSKLTDDMFKDGLPLNDQNSSEKFRAYQAFGCLMASLANSGNGTIPVVLRKEVIMYAFGNSDMMNNSNSSDELTVNLEPMRMQMIAIRSGVLKIEMTCPSIRRFASPIAAQTLLLLPTSPIQFVERIGSENVKFFTEDMFLLPYLRRVLSQNFVVDKITPPIISFVDSIEITYSKENNTINLPSTDLWIQCFVQRIQQTRDQVNC